MKKRRSLFNLNLTYLAQNKKILQDESNYCFSLAPKRQEVILFGSTSTLFTKMNLFCRKNNQIDKISLISLNYRTLMLNPYLLAILFKIFKNFIFDELVFAFKTKPLSSAELKKELKKYFTSNLVGFKIIFR